MAWHQGREVVHTVLTIKEALDAAYAEHDEARKDLKAVRDGIMLGIEKGDPDHFNTFYRMEDDALNRYLDAEREVLRMDHIYDYWPDGYRLTKKSDRL